MKFKIGQKVVIRKALGEESGEGRGRYYYGRHISELPLGTKGVVSEIVREFNKIYLRFKDKLGQEHSWRMHPRELAIDEDSEKKQRVKYCSCLDSVLLESSVKPVVRNKRERPFVPKFNAKEEFVVWIREQFPKLEKYAESKRTYLVLSKRINEVKEAAEKAWGGVKKATKYAGYEGSGKFCHRRFLRPYFNDFYNSINHCSQGKNQKNYVSKLNTLVCVLEISGTSRFPYNSAAEKFRRF